MSRYPPRSPDTERNQACTAASSTITIPIQLSPNNYPVTERTCPHIYRLLLSRYPPRSPDTNRNQACTAASSTILIPIRLSPDDYLVTERTCPHVYRLLLLEFCLVHNVL